MKSLFAAVRRIAELSKLGNAGAAAVEVALAAPVLVSLVVGEVDFGNVFTQTQTLAAATRAGAEYARGSTTCKSGVQMLPTPTVSSNCSTGIQDAITNSATFRPALTFAANGTDGSPFALNCYCDKSGTLSPFPNGTDCTKSPNYSCTSNSAGANAVFIAITATQTVTPILKLPVFPTTLSGVTEVRLQ